MTIAEEAARRAASRRRLEKAGWAFIDSLRDDDTWSCIARRPGLMCEQTSRHSAEHALDKAIRYASMVSMIGTKKEKGR